MKALVSLLVVLFSPIAFATTDDCAGKVDTSSVVVVLDAKDPIRVWAIGYEGPKSCFQELRIEGCSQMELSSDADELLCDDQSIGHIYGYRQKELRAKVQLFDDVRLSQEIPETK